MKTPTLQTNRLTLRPLSIEDAPAVQKYFDDWNIIQYICNAPWPYPTDGALTHIRDTVLPNVEKDLWHAWAITLKNGNNEAIGMLTYNTEAKKNKDNRGFWLATKYHKQGLMSEAVARVNDFLFDELNIERFTARNIKGNIGSRRIKEKTGALYLGDMPETTLQGEKTMELWEVTKESWNAARKN